MPAVSRVCFGVPFSLDPGVPAEATALKALDAMNASASKALDATRDRIRADRRGVSPQKVAVTPHPAAPKVTAAGLSLLDDCGIPRVNTFGPFSENLHGQLNPETLPNIGFSSPKFGADTLAPMWTRPRAPIIAGLLTKLFGGFPEQQDYYQQVNYLTRLNPKDDIWSSSPQSDWFSQYAGGLQIYMSDLFAGHFVDRNGTALSFNLSSLATALKSLDPKEISPQLAGGIVSAFVEFLGDQLYQVPYYSPEILKAYRDQRDDAGAVNVTGATLKTLTDAVSKGKISASNAQKLLGISSPGGADLTFTFAPVAAGAPVIASDVARAILALIQQLDATQLAQRTAVVSAGEAITQIGGGKSALQSKYTCFKAGVQKQNLAAIFAVDGTTGTPLGTAVNDTGRSVTQPGQNADFGDLIGRMIAQGAATADKSVRSIVGGLTRGVSIASLQNEVLAELVASLAAALARKFMESAIYATVTDFLANPTSGISAADKQAHIIALAKAIGLLPR